MAGAGEVGMAKVKRTARGYTVVHSRSGVRLGWRRSKRAAQRLARVIRRRNRR